jgi:hypothetical protein
MPRRLIKETHGLALFRVAFRLPSIGALLPHTGSTPIHEFGYYCQPPPSALYSCTIESASFSCATTKLSCAV